MTIKWKDGKVDRSNHYDYGRCGSLVAELADALDEAVKALHRITTYGHVDTCHIAAQEALRRIGAID